MGERRTLVSVDLDDVACYHGIHGLPAPSADARSVVLERCLPRFLELFESLGGTATFFVIGRDLERDLRTDGRGATLLKEALAAGHELANHSYAHAYDFSSWQSASIRSDVEACDILLRGLGAEVRGFRAPGYTHDRAVLSVLAEMGYRYDSSSLPSPLYYAAKLGAIAMMAVRGKRSQSQLRGAGSFFGRRHPFQTVGGLWELPISVVGIARWPLVGTAITSAPALLSKRIADLGAREDDVHLELHGLDLADPARDHYDAALIRAQPELRASLSDKLARLREFLERRGPFTRLCDAV